MSDMRVRLIGEVEAERALVHTLIHSSPSKSPPLYTCTLLCVRLALVDGSERGVRRSSSQVVERGAGTVF